MKSEVNFGGRMQFVSNKTARSDGHLLGTYAASAAAVPLHAAHACSGCSGPFYHRLPLGPTLASANSKAQHVHRVQACNCFVHSNAHSTALSSKKERCTDCTLPLPLLYLLRWRGRPMFTKGGNVLPFKHCLSIRARGLSKSRFPITQGPPDIYAAAQISHYRTNAACIAVAARLHTF
jgi:hypothetical protein